MGSLLNRYNYYPATWAAGCDVCRIYLHVQRVDAVVQGDYHGWRQWKPNYTAHNYILMWHWTSCWWRCVVKQPKPRCFFFYIFILTHAVHHRLFTNAVHHRLFTNAVHHRLFTNAVHHRLFTSAVYHRLFTNAVHHRLFTNAVHHRLLTNAVYHRLFPHSVYHRLFKSNQSLLFISTQSIKMRRKKNDVWAQEATFKINKSIK